MSSICKLVFYLVVSICEAFLHCDMQKYQYLVTIRYESESQDFCSGIFVHPTWVLSVAHCYYGRDINDQTDVLVKGMLVPPDATEEIKVVLIAIHDLFDPKRLKYDFALLKLKEFFPVISVFAKLGSEKLVADPVLLRKGLALKRYCVIIGWARVYLMEPACHQVPIKHTYKCEEKLQAVLDQDLLICVVSATNDGSPCKKVDSGLPILYDDVVLGLMAYSKHCGKEREPIIFAKIEEGLGFIKDELKRHGLELKADKGKNGSTVYSVTDKSVGVEKCLLLLLFSIALISSV